jgi:putative hydrolase of the HAD superfamily
VLDAVLFDWGGTLMDWVWDDELLVAGIHAGLTAVNAPPDAADLVVARYRGEVALNDFDAPEEVEYERLVRTMLGDSGVDVDNEALRAYLLAEHAAWAPARRLASMSVALLDALRDRGLKTALVSNAMDPAWILLRDLEEQELRARLDAIVFSSDVGVRKPSPKIFERALDELGVAPDRSAFVGDRLEADVRGARELGMKTIQAMWFRAEERDDIEADFQAFTQFDVLNIVDRLRAAD